ncbi:MAG: ABC transporter ATP-binding protein [Pirellulaceae bacterium]|nr:ABC transporter ATP-binding protein [Pirellulaceae bacterium]
MSSTSSRQRFREYRQEVAQRHRSGQRPGRFHSERSDTDASTASHRSFWVLLVQFWRELGTHRLKVVVALTTLTVSTLLGLIPPAGTKLAIDYVLTEPRLELPNWLASRLGYPTPMQLLWMIAAAVVVVTLLRTVVHIWGRKYATQAVQLMQADLRRRVFEHAMRLPLHRIQMLKSGGATSLIREDAGGVADLIFNMIYNPWQAIVQLVGSFIVLLLVDWRLLVGGLLLLPAVWLTHRTWIYRVRPLYKDIRKRRQHVDASTTETFGGIRVVRTFARGKSESNRFVKSTHLIARQQMMVWWATRLLEIVWEVIIPLASTGLLLYGGWQILNGRMSLGDLMMFLVYLTMLLGPIASIASSAMSFQNNLAGLDRVLDLLQEQTETAQQPGTRPVVRSDVAGAIQMNGVCFSYPGSDRLVLADINFTAPAGSTIALVGRSGAGKTTLCNLVARFYNPTHGTIELDGRNVTEISLESYRKILGVVEQEVFLFDGTIFENVAYGRQGASVDEVTAAAQAAAALQFIQQLPQGFKTVIGERGFKLSGGQRQRLAIARAILADPKILILDEATSNLDSESERLIQSSLAKLLTGRTAFVIAHRLSTIMHADQILVLDEGRIVERGTHQQLMDHGGLYQRMVLLQTQPAN